MTVSKSREKEILRQWRTFTEPITVTRDLLLRAHLPQAKKVRSALSVTPGQRGCPHPVGIRLQVPVVTQELQYPCFLLTQGFCDKTKLF